jgi:hypothetical protein
MDRTVEAMLRSYVADDSIDCELLAYAEFAVKNAWQASMQNTPFYLNDGQYPSTPIGAPIREKSCSPSAYDFAARDCMLKAQQCIWHCIWLPGMILSTGK